jgi:hypothetical protein
MQWRCTRCGIVRQRRLNTVCGNYGHHNWVEYRGGAGGFVYGIGFIVGVICGIYNLVSSIFKDILAKFKNGTIRDVFSNSVNVTTGKIKSIDLNKILKVSIQVAIPIFSFIFLKFVIKAGKFVTIAIPISITLIIFGPKLMQSDNMIIIYCWIGIIWFVYIVMNAFKLYGWKKGLLCLLTSLVLIIPLGYWCIKLIIDNYKIRKQEKEYIDFSEIGDDE